MATETDEPEVVICRYCGSPARLTSSAEVYNGQDFGLIYLCTRYPACDAFCGVHKGTTRAKGNLANAELRRWRKSAHGILDPLWKNGIMPRARVYALAARLMEIPGQEMHIGMFDVERCKRLCWLLSEWKDAGMPGAVKDEQDEQRTQTE